MQTVDYDIKRFQQEVKMKNKLLFNDNTYKKF